MLLSRLNTTNCQYQLVRALSCLFSPQPVKANKHLSNLDVGAYILRIASKQASNIYMHNGADILTLIRPQPHLMAE
eukprot:scaffold186675_cov19-Prasinocladus_malaysianus.AAC.1